MISSTRFWPAESEKRIILVIVGALFLLSVIKSGYYTLSYGGTDLRSISISAKMLDSGVNAYFYRWSPGEPEQYINPNLPTAGYTNGVTVAPGTLYVLSLFNFLSYPALRITWTIVQYFFAIYIFCFFLFQKKNLPDTRFWIAVIAMFFIFCTPVWFLNIERGQVYLLFAFLFTLIYQCYSSSKPWGRFAAGMLIAIAAYCRPNFIVLIVPLIMVRDWRALWGGISAAILLGLHAYTHSGLWDGYAAVVNEFSEYMDKKPATTLIAPQYPAVIEGVDNLTKYKTDFLCGGITPINGLVNALIGKQAYYFYAALMILLSICLVLIYRKRLQRTDAASVMLFGFLLFISIEYIMPAPRAAYNLVIWIFPILLLVQQVKLSNINLILLATAFCLINSFPFYFPYLHDIGEGILCYLILYFIATPKPAKLPS